jgi:hypothetical protein
MGFSCSHGCWRVQATLATLSSKILRQSMHKSDERTKLEADVVVGIEAVKTQAWEKAFMSTIAAIRSQELKVLLFVQELKVPLLVQTANSAAAQHVRSNIQRAQETAELSVCCRNSGRGSRWLR